MEFSTKGDDIVKKFQALMKDHFTVSPLLVFPPTFHKTCIWHPVHMPMGNSSPTPPIHHILPPSSQLRQTAHTFPVAL